MPICSVNNVRDMMLSANDKTVDPLTETAIKNLTEKRAIVKHSVERFDRFAVFSSGYGTAFDATVVDLRAFKMSESDSVPEQLEAFQPILNGEDQKFQAIVHAQSERLRAFLIKCNEFDQKKKVTNDARIQYDLSRKELQSKQKKSNSAADAKRQAKEQKAAIYDKAYHDANRELQALSAQYCAEAAFLVTDATQIVLTALGDEMAQLGQQWQSVRLQHPFMKPIEPSSVPASLNATATQDPNSTYSAPHTAPGTPQKTVDSLPPTATQQHQPAHGEHQQPFQQQQQQQHYQQQQNDHQQQPPFQQQPYQQQPYQQPQSNQDSFQQNPQPFQHQPYQQPLSAGQQPIAKHEQQPNDIHAPSSPIRG